MEKHFVDYNQALALKELGFNESCLASWNFYTNEFNYNPYPSTFSSDDVIQLPLKSQVFEWFRKQHKLKGFVEPVEYLDDTPETYMWVVYNECHSGAEQLTYEEAESACIDKLIEIVKNK